jgi:hypothetical protein
MRPEEVWLTAADGIQINGWFDEARADWASAWLTCLAFFFPLHWACEFLLRAVPALIRATVFGYRLEFFRISLFGGMAVAVEPRTAAMTAAMPGPGKQQGFIETGLVLGIALLILVVAQRRFVLLSGLGAATLGESALVSFLMPRAFGERLSAPLVVTTLCSFAILVLGMRWILLAVPARSVWKRMIGLLAFFVVPLAVLRSVQALAGILWFPPSWLAILLLPGTLAAALASLLPSGIEKNPRPRLRSAHIVFGVLTSVLLGSGLYWGAPVLNEAYLRAKQQSNRAALANLPEVAPDAPYGKLFFQKGVSLTAEFPAPYDSEGARAMLEVLPQYDVNAVALVPYGFAVRGQPHVHLNADATSWENDDGITQLARLAHARGMKVMLKPGIWVRGGFAGDLEFSSPQDRATWFAEYRTFLEHYARLATRIHADILCVGGELTKLTPYSDEWRKLIARARELYPGPLVYAANFGDEFETLTFWDALDYIGLQEYYPLPDNLSIESVLRKVEVVQRNFQRPVIFTEAGFTSSEHANRAPWADPRGGKIALDQQARCYEALLNTFYRRPWFQGVYWWAVRTNGEGGPENGSFTPWGKPAMQVLRYWYRDEGR